MTERPDQKRMLRVRDLVPQLPEEEHLALGNATGAGLFNARMAAKCLTDPGPQNENVLQMLKYLLISTLVSTLALPGWPWWRRFSDQSGGQ
jgi:hypothetical protein